MRERFNSPSIRDIKGYMKPKQHNTYGAYKGNRASLNPQGKIAVIHSPTKDMANPYGANSRNIQKIRNDRKARAKRGNYSMDTNYDKRFMMKSFKDNEKFKNIRNNIKVNKRKVDGAKPVASQSERLVGNNRPQMSNRSLKKEKPPHEGIRITDMRKRKDNNPNKENTIKNVGSVKRDIATPMKPEMTISPKMAKYHADNVTETPVSSVSSQHSNNSYPKVTQSLRDTSKNGSNQLTQPPRNTVRVSEKNEIKSKIHEANKKFRDRKSLQPKAIASLQSSFAMQSLKRNSENEAVDKNSFLSASSNVNKSLLFGKKETPNNQGLKNDANRGNKAQPEVKPFAGEKELTQNSNQKKFSPDKMKGSLIIHKKNLSKSSLSKLSQFSLQSPSLTGSSHTLASENKAKNALSAKEALNELRKSIKIPTPSNSHRKNVAKSNKNLKSCLKKNKNGGKKQKLNVTFNPVVQTNDKQSGPLNDQYPKVPKMNNKNMPNQINNPQNLHYHNPPVNNGQAPQQMARPLRFVGGNNSAFRNMNRAMIRQRDGYPRVAPPQQVPMQMKDSIDHRKPIMRVSVVQNQNNLPNNRKQQQKANQPMNLKFETKKFETKIFGSIPNSVMNSSVPQELLMSSTSVGSTPPTPGSIVAIKQGASPIQPQNIVILNSPNHKAPAENLALSLVGGQNPSTESFVMTPRNPRDPRIGSPSKAFQKMEVIYKKNANKKMQQQKKKLVSPQMKKFRNHKQVSGVISNKKAGSLFINGANMIKIEQEQKRKMAKGQGYQLRETRPNMKRSIVNPMERERMNSPDPASTMRRSLRNKKPNNRQRVGSMQGKLFKTDPVGMKTTQKPMVQGQQQINNNAKPKNFNRRNHHGHFSSFTMQNPMQANHNSARNLAEAMRMSLQHTVSGQNLEAFKNKKFNHHNIQKNGNNGHGGKNPLSHNFRSPKPNLIQNINQMKNAVPPRHSQSGQINRRDNNMRFNSAPRNPMRNPTMRQRTGTMTPTRGYQAMRPQMGNYGKGDHQEYGNGAQFANNRFRNDRHGYKARQDGDEDGKCTLI